jgi:orotate phosphoribosyltransferase
MWSEELPNDIDLIVGVPRSGMLVGNLLALHLNTALTDVEGLQTGSILQSGRRLKQTGNIEDYDRIFIVDDTVNSGKTINNVKRKIDLNRSSEKMIYGAVYVSPNGKNEVDTFAAILPNPRVFEWNLYHHPRLENWCMDMDGVLCRDPTPEENDDGEKYEKFIEDVKPKIIPSKEIGAIVTCRLEKYRDETKEWLSKHGIQYQQLFMMDYASKEVRQSRGNYAEYKANIFEQTGSQLFIESSENQAKKIADLANKSVFCTGTNQIFQPGNISQMSERIKKSAQTVGSSPSQYARKFYSAPVSFTKGAINYIFNRNLKQQK